MRLVLCVNKNSLSLWKLSGWLSKYCHLVEFQLIVPLFWGAPGWTLRLLWDSATVGNNWRANDYVSNTNPKLKEWGCVIYFPAYLSLSVVKPTVQLPYFSTRWYKNHLFTSSWKYHEVIWYSLPLLITHKISKIKL